MLSDDESSLIVFQEDLSDMLKAYAVNHELAREVERLKKENDELRKYF